MLALGQHVILGVSGGADSMCLLFVLHSLMEKWQLKLTAVHIHHSLRDQAADADQAFVVDYCKKLGIQCICRQGDIRQLAENWHMSLEEAGRKFRYMCFEDIANECKGDVIAVAHHKDDLAETVLFNLFRGSWLKGLGGIAPVRGQIIRPLLCVTRKEIEETLAKENISYCIDATNLETDYTRNKIRLDILPEITKHINTNAVEHISRSAEATRAANEYIEQCAKSQLEAMKNQQGDIDIEKLKQQPEIIQNEIVRLWFYEKTGKLKDITWVHIESMRQLIDKADGKAVDLPYNIKAIRKGPWLVLENPMEQKELEHYETVEQEFNVKVPCSISVDQGRWTFEFSIKPYESGGEIPEKTYTKWLDYDKINFGLKLRHRYSNDFLVVNPQGNHKKINRLMIDEKIPRHLRDQMWMIADGNHVLWVPGIRISEAYKITKETRQVLIIQVEENQHGR